MDDARLAAAGDAAVTLPVDARGTAPARSPGPWQALREHWPEYLMEALGLGLFMISACAFGTLLEHPESPLRHALTEPLARRALMGIAMGLTAVGLIYSPWGRRSGAHMNPAVTLAFARLGHVARWDAAFYTLAQFVGGVTGVALMAWLLGLRLAAPDVNYVVTRPGTGGPWLALAAELAISFGMMALVLASTGRKRLAPWTGALAGTLLALWITIEAPLSGTSMNPARTFGSASVAGEWTGWWIYFIAPPLGMLMAAEAVRLARGRHTGCAKLHHPARVRCIFCGQPGSRAATSAARAEALVTPARSRREGPSPDAGTFPASPALSTGSRQP